MGSADNNFTMTIQRIRDDTAQQAQVHEQQIQQLHEMFMQLSAQLVPPPATPQPLQQQATIAMTSIPHQLPPPPHQQQVP